MITMEIYLPKSWLYLKVLFSMLLLSYGVSHGQLLDTIYTTTQGLNNPTIVGKIGNKLIINSDDRSDLRTESWVGSVDLITFEFTYIWRDMVGSPRFIQINEDHNYLFLTDDFGIGRLGYDSNQFNFEASLNIETNPPFNDRELFYDFLPEEIKVSYYTPLLDSSGYQFHFLSLDHHLNLMDHDSLSVGHQLDGIETKNLRTLFFSRTHGRFVGVLQHQNNISFVEFDLDLKQTQLYPLPNDITKNFSNISFQSVSKPDRAILRFREVFLDGLEFVMTYDQIRDGSMDFLYKIDSETCLSYRKEWCTLRNVFDEKGVLSGRLYPKDGSEAFTALTGINLDHNSLIFQMVLKDRVQFWHGIYYTWEFTFIHDIQWFDTTIAIAIKSDFDLDPTQSWFRLLVLDEHGNHPSRSPGLYDENKNLILVPNPSNGEAVYVPLSEPFRIVNTAGQLVAYYETGGMKNLSFLPSGVFFLRSASGKKGKLVIAHGE